MNSLQAYAISDVSIVDVVQGVIRRGMTVTTAEGRIQSIEAAGGREPAAGFQRIDGRELFLMPGLIDAHVHYFDPASFGPILLANGVVMVRDMGNPSEQALQLREALREGRLLGPEMITTGWILDGEPPQIPPISLPCSTAEQGRERVRQQVLAGVDQIKVYSDLEHEVFLAIVDEATKQGIQPVGHVPEAVYIEEAAAAGLRSSEHLFGFEKMIARLLGDEIPIQKGGMGAYIHYWMRLREVDRNVLRNELKKINETGIVICPTLVVFFGHSRAKEIFTGSYPYLEYVSPQIRNIWNMFWNPTESEIDLYQKISPHMQAFVYELHNAGIPLLIGTDLTTFGIIPGYSLHEEMKLWQDAGIPPVEVLRSATITPARFLGLEESLGSIEAGRKASMVLVQGNPLEDIRNASRIAGVFLRGRFFSTEELSSLIPVFGGAEAEAINREA